MLVIGSWLVVVFVPAEGTAGGGEGFFGVF